MVEATDQQRANFRNLTEYIKQADYTEGYFQHTIKEIINSHRNSSSFKRLSLEDKIEITRAVSMIFHSDPEVFDDCLDSIYDLNLDMLMALSYGSNKAGSEKFVSKKRFIVYSDLSQILYRKFAKSGDFESMARNAELAYNNSVEASHAFWQIEKPSEMENNIYAKAHYLSLDSAKARKDLEIQYAKSPNAETVIKWARNEIYSRQAIAFSDHSSKEEYLKQQAKISKLSEELKLLEGRAISKR